MNRFNSHSQISIHQATKNKLLIAINLLLCLLLITSQTVNANPSLAPMLKNVTPAVVNISTSQARQQTANPLMQDPFFRYFFEQNPQHYKSPQQSQRPAQSAGSGVIVDSKKGIIITNYHVVKDADEVIVQLTTGHESKAKVLGSDPEVDLAVLELENREIIDSVIQLPLNDTDSLQVGDFVAAVGNPFGLGQTVTTGIISALGRTGLGIEGYENFIQTDASINPGNSGGALVNYKGELIGINTAILAPTGGNVGIGFAIPANMVKASMDQILKYGEVKRGMLGILIQDLTPDLAQAFQLDDRQQGVLIAQVQPGSSAERAGLREGDVVTYLNGKKMTSSAALRNAIGIRPIGEKIELDYLRNGKKFQQQVVIGAKDSPVSAANPAKLPSNDEGAVDERLAGLSITNDRQPGIIVDQIQADSAASYSGLRQGDRILQVNREVVDSVKAFNQALESSPKQLLMRIERSGIALYLAIQ